MIQDIWSNILLEFQSNDFLKGGAVVSVMMALWAYVKQIPTQISRLYHRYCTLSITIPQGTEMFTDISYAIYEQHKDSGSGRFAAGSRLIATDSEDEEEQIRFAHLSPTSKTINNTSIMPFGVRYHRVGWCIVRSSISQRDLDNASSDNAVTYSVEITLFGLNKKATIGKLLGAGQEKRLKKSLRVKTSERDYWNYGNLLKPRTVAQVVTGRTKEIVDDLKAFVAASEWYLTRGIPYRRGILLYGPPGTGKSSVAQVVANELNMDLHVMSMSNMTSSNIHSLMSGSNKLILIEDMDVACNVVDNRKKSDKDKKGATTLTLSDVLNAIDGVSSGSGNILIITTNDRESLDPALLRPGRIDKHYEIGYLTQDTFDKLCELYYGKTCGFKITDNLTAAQVQGTFIENPHDIEKFEEALWKNHSQN